LTLGLTISGLLPGQTKYELLFLQGEFEQILLDSKELEVPEDYYWNAAVLSREGKAIEAINVLESGMSNFEDNEQIELLLSELYFNNGQFPKAKPLLIKHQDSPGKLLQLIDILEFEKNYIDAIALLDKKIVEDSLNIPYLVHLGENNYQIDSIEKAIGYLEKVISINPEDQVTANKLANIYLKIKNFERILEICDPFLLNDSTNKTFTRLKGMASFNLDNFKTSEKCFNYLLIEGDSSKFILKHLGISELNIMSWHTGRDHLKLAFQLDSNDFETCFFLGKAFLNSMEKETGLWFLDRADSLLQADPLILSVINIERQSIYAALEQYDKALEHYQIAYDLNPRPEYLFYMGSMCEYGLKDRKKAVEYFELFLTKLPPKPEPEEGVRESPFTVSLRKVAEENISRLKEELFFEGKLEEE